MAVKLECESEEEGENVRMREKVGKETLVVKLEELEKDGECEMFLSLSWYSRDALNVYWCRVVFWPS